MVWKFTAGTVTRLGPQSDTQLQIYFQVRTLLSFCDVSIGTEFSVYHVAGFECCGCAFVVQLTHIDFFFIVVFF